MNCFLVVSALVLSNGMFVQGSDWPGGTYGLMKAASGCPEGGVEWREGSRTFDTENSDAHNYFSDHVWNQLAGTYDANDITTEFCMKIAEDNSTVHASWPNGSYCIFQYKACPDGFQSGLIFWDDNDFSNKNSITGYVPDGVYTTNTQINFCCRNDGQPENQILLPTIKPFILLRYKYHCQQVEGMRVEEAFVRWDDEDTLNTDRAEGAHPYDDGGSKDHKLHFCYYSSINQPIVG